MRKRASLIENKKAKIISALKEIDEGIHIILVKD